MRTRCIHRGMDLCSRCHEKALRDRNDGDDRYWFCDGEDWIYNPNAFVSKIGRAPMSDGIAVSAGGAGDNLPVMQYDPNAAFNGTIQPMSTPLTNEEVAELQAKLDTAINGAAEWQRIATESLAERKAMSKRHHEQLDQIERNQPTTASRQEVARMEKRIGDADRNRFIEHLGNMFADGHLSEDEFGERSDKANAAKTLSDLYPLVADLPDMPVPVKDLKIAGSPLEPRRTLKDVMAMPASPTFVLTALGILAVFILMLTVLI